MSGSQPFQETRKDDKRTSKYALRLAGNTIVTCLDRDRRKAASRFLSYPGLAGRSRVLGRSR